MPLSAADLVALWHFDENIGLIANDSTGNGNDGTVYGASWVDGKLGKALSFDGIDDHVDCGDISTANWTSLTTEAWVYWDGGTLSGYAGVYCKAAYGNDIGRLLINGAGKILVQNGNGDFYSNSGVVPVNEWCHIAYVYDQVAGKEYIYVNGDQEGEQPRTGDIAQNSTDFCIGYGWGGSTYYIFSGLIDEVRIWDGALTKDEIEYSHENNLLHVDDDWDQYPGAYRTITEALAVAVSGDTIIVEAGTYNEGITIIDKDLTIIGATSKPIIKPTENTGLDNKIGAGGRGWFQITGANVIFQNLVFDGTGQNIRTALHYHEDSTGGTVEYCDFLNIRHISQYYGRGINNYGQHVDVLDCTFTNIQRIGVFTFNTTADTLIKDCTYTGKGAGDWLDYGIEFGGGGSGTVDGCDISACTGIALVDDSTSAGILATDYYGTGTVVTVKNSTLTGNSDGIAVGFADTDATVLTAHCNNISGNTFYGICNVGTEEVDATNNWWGHATGPLDDYDDAGGFYNPYGEGDSVSDNVDYSNWAYIPDFCDCEAKTIGYWKNHPGYVDGIIAALALREPSEKIVVGTGKIVGDDVFADNIFTKPHSKTYSMLAAQLLAAKLNVAQLSQFNPDYEFDCVSDEIAEADIILSYEDGHNYDDPLLKSDKADVNIIKDVLDDFNNNGCAGNDCPCMCY